MVTSRFELNGKLLFLQQSQSFSSPIVSFDSPKSKKLSSADFQIHFANGSSKLIQMKFHNFPIRKISNQENYFKEAHLQEILEIRDKYANEVDFFFLIYRLLMEQIYFLMKKIIGILFPKNYPKRKFTIHIKI